MAVFINPLFDILDNLSLLGVKLAPAISDWIEAKIPAEKQHEITKRMKRCYRLCKHGHLTGVLVLRQVSVLFQDQQPTEQDNIGQLMLAWLSNK